MAWNKKVQHILASCSTNGSCVVWDLKKQKPVISFRDPNRCVWNVGVKTNSYGLLLQIAEPAVVNARTEM